MCSNKTLSKIKSYLLYEPSFVPRSISSPRYMLAHPMLQWQPQLPVGQVSMDTTVSHRYAPPCPPDPRHKPGIQFEITTENMVL